MLFSPSGSPSEWPKVNEIKGLSQVASYRKRLKGRKTGKGEITQFLIYNPNKARIQQQQKEREI